MLKRKPIREKGKIRFSEYFKELKEGDKISIVREVSLKAGFPKRIQGRTGYVVRKQGKAYIINVNDNKKMKHYIIKPIHLRRTHSIGHRKHRERAHSMPITHSPLRSPFHRASELHRTRASRVIENGHRS